MKAAFKIKAPPQPGRKFNFSGNHFYFLLKKVGLFCANEIKISTNDESVRLLGEDNLFLRALERC